MKIRAFILHLERATDRRKNVETLLEDCGLDGDIWPAVDGSALSARDIEIASESPLFQPAYPFALRPGEVGCFLSHRQVWQEIERQDMDAALILEDDVRLDLSLFPDALALAIENVNRFGYIKLRNSTPKGNAPIIGTQGTAALACSKEPGLGTQAQLLSRAAAGKLLKCSQRIDRPVDTFVQSHWFTGLPPATVYPAGIAHIGKELAGSTIQGKTKGLRSRLLREIRRARYRYAVKRVSRRQKDVLPLI